MTDTPEPAETEAGRHRWRLFLVLSCMTIVGLAGMVGLVSLLPAAAAKPPDTFLVMLNCPNSEPVYLKAHRNIRTTDVLLKSILPGNEPLSSVPFASSIDTPDLTLIQTLIKSPFPGWTASLASPTSDYAALEEDRAQSRSSVVKQMRSGIPMAVAKLRGQRSSTAGVLFTYSYYGGRGGYPGRPVPGALPAPGAPSPEYTPSGHMFASVEQFYTIWNEAGRPPVFVFRDTKEYTGTYSVTGYTTDELADLDR